MENLRKWLPYALLLSAALSFFTLLLAPGYLSAEEYTWLHILDGTKTPWVFPLFPWDKVYENNFYRPLSYAPALVSFFLFGSAAGLARWAGVLIHCINSVLCLAYLRQRGWENTSAIRAALFALCSPVAMNAIGFTLGAHDLVLTTTLLCFLLVLEREKYLGTGLFVFLILLTAVATLASKETALLLLPLAALWQAIDSRRWRGSCITVCILVLFALVRWRALYYLAFQHEAYHFFWGREIFARFFLAIAYPWNSTLSELWQFSVDPWHGFNLLTAAVALIFLFVMLIFIWPKKNQYKFALLVLIYLTPLLLAIQRFNPSQMYPTALLLAAALALAWERFPNFSRLKKSLLLGLSFLWLVHAPVVSARTHSAARFNAEFMASWAKALEPLWSCPYWPSDSHASHTLYVEIPADLPGASALFTDNFFQYVSHPDEEFQLRVRVLAPGQKPEAEARGALVRLDRTGNFSFTRCINSAETE